MFVNEIENEGWPATHTNDEECLRPYNENMFLIMHDYNVVFPEEEFAPMEDDDESMKDTSKLVKMKYTINILPSMGYHTSKTVCPYSGTVKNELKNQDINICALCAESDEIDIFKAGTLQDLIAFKWEKFGKKFHLVGCIVHFLYMIILFFYTDLVYLHGPNPDYSDEESASRLLRGAGAGRSSGGGGGGSCEPPECVIHRETVTMDTPYNYVLLLGVIYPASYEIIQMCKGGVMDYLTDSGNYVDLIYIYGSIAMSFLHGSSLGPYHFASKLLMCIVALLAIRRTFNFLRIFSAFSPIVTMLTSVIWQLRIFMTFYFILCLLFSLMLDVLGLANTKLKGGFRDEFWIQKEGVW